MIRPLGRRVLVRPSTPEDKTESGIIIPEGATNVQYMTGHVEEVGSRVELDVKKGDHIAFSKVFDEVKSDKETYYIVEEPFLIAVFE